MKAYIINPAEEFVVEAPTGAGNIKNFIRGFFFKKKKWNKDKITDWIKSKFRVKNVEVKPVGDEYHVVISKLKSHKYKKVPFHISEGITAELGTDMGVSNTCFKRKPRAKEVLENPKFKITQKIITLVKDWYKAGKTPKQINTLLEEKNLPTLHPTTIQKIATGKYPQAKSIQEAKSIKKEVVMRSNPMITEILENPSVIEAALQNKAIPLVKTNWFQTRAKELQGKGLPAPEIANLMNEELLSHIPDNFWRRMARVRIGKKGTPISGKPGRVIVPRMVRYFFKKISPIPDPWNLIDPEKLRGTAKKLWEEGGTLEGVKVKPHDKKSLYRALQARMVALKENHVMKPWTSPATKALMKSFSPAGKKAKAGAKSGTTGAKSGTKRKRKKKSVGYEVGEIDDALMETIGNSVMVEDFVNGIDEFDLAEMPVDVEEVISNPLFRKGTLSAAFTKLGYQLPGVIAGAWALKASSGFFDILLKMIPEGKIKDIVSALLANGVIWSLAELLPTKYSVTTNAIQTLALYKAANQILNFGKFNLVPDITQEKPATPPPVKDETVKDETVKDETEEEILAEIDQDIYDAWERGELTDEEVAQLVLEGKEDITQGEYSQRFVADNGERFAVIEDEPDKYEYTDAEADEFTDDEVSQEEYTYLE